MARARPEPHPGHRRADDRHAGALHAVDPAEVGLADFGRPEGFLRPAGAPLEEAARRVAQPRRSRASTSCTRARADMPDEHGRRRSCTATTGSTTCSSAPDDKIAAVVDWEMATLGDPLTDLGAARGLPADGQAAEGPMAERRRPAIPARREILDRYAAGQRARPVRSRLLHRPRLVQARGDPRGHPLPVRPRPDGRRGIRADRHAGRAPGRLRTGRDCRKDS